MLMEVPWDKEGKCCECGEIFSFAGDLISHIQHRHTNDTEKLRIIYQASRGKYVNKMININKKCKLVPACGLCHNPLGKKSKGKKCYFCGAVFTNPEILKSGGK